jgi:hypothetical protein
MNANDWFEEEEVNLDAVTLKEFEDLCGLLYEKKRSIEEVEEEVKQEKVALEKLKNKVLSYLVHYKKDNYRSEHGMVIKSNILEVRVGDKKAFTEFLRSRNLLEDFTTFNANKVKGLVLEEIEIAAKEEKEFAIPGVSKPQYIEKLSMRK